MAQRTHWAIPCALVLSLWLPLSATAGIKCWTDKDGTRECGNVVPPEYSQQKTTTFNDQGVATDVSAAAKTPEEIEQEKAAQEAAAKQAAQEKQQQQQQAAYDHMLLATFTTEQDIIRSRDRKLSAIDASIEVTTATIAGLQKKLDELQQRAAASERNGRPLSDEIKDDMAATQQQIEGKQKYIAYSQQEKANIDKQYAAYLQRFRELEKTQQQPSQ